MAFVAASVDGYIARGDGSLDWLARPARALPPSEDCGYAAFLQGADGLLMGRAGYERVARLGLWPFGDLPVTVLGARVAAAAPPRANVTWSSEAPQALLERLAQRGHRRLCLQGGRLLHAFIAQGLLDEITITTLPCLLGAGRPLFGALPADLRLQHLHTRHWPFGFVQTRWRIAADAPVDAARA